MHSLPSNFYYRGELLFSILFLVDWIILTVQVTLENDKVRIYVCTILRYIHIYRFVNDLCTVLNIRIYIYIEVVSLEKPIIKIVLFNNITV